jgi:DNA-binding PadR family transcriptional regulator
MHKHEAHFARQRSDNPADGDVRGFGGGDFRAAFGPFGGPFPGRGGPFGPRGRGRGPGGRARRGDVRAAVIALLTERPMHGYEIIQELSERTGGLWKPSPGSVYPTLQLLEDEGLVAAEEDGGKRRYSLTDTGRGAASEQAGQKAPWEQLTDGAEPELLKLRQSTGLLIAAVHQLMHAGTSAQQGEAEAILADARRRLYAILATEK